MRLPPLLAALRWHKAGAILIGLQIALTLAIVSNALFIIDQRIVHLQRPTGIQEQDLFVVGQQLVAHGSADSTENLDAIQLADLAAIRQLPDVVSVAAVSSVPLLGTGSWNTAISLKPGDQDSDFNVSEYMMDDAALRTLGMHLLAGRNFSASEVQHVHSRENFEAPVIIITQAVAQRLYPHGALGQRLFIYGAKQSSLIIGIVDRLQTPEAHGWGDGFAYNSVIVPFRVDSLTPRYAVRAKPGRLLPAMKAVRNSMLAINPMRVLSRGHSDMTRDFATIRAKAYRTDFGTAVLMGVISLILITVTAAGIIGLTSFWVGQRRRQIGVRRALGARQLDILRYFLLENLLITSLGGIVGIVLAIGLNRVMMDRFELPGLPALMVLAGCVIMFVLGQIAAWVPAWRASRISPIVAMRVS